MNSRNDAVKIECADNTSVSTVLGEYAQYLFRDRLLLIADTFFLTVCITSIVILPVWALYEQKTLDIIAIFGIINISSV